MEWTKGEGNYTKFMATGKKDKNGSEVFSLDAWMNHSDIIRKTEHWRNPPGDMDLRPKAQQVKHKAIRSRTEGKRVSQPGGAQRRLLLLVRQLSHLNTTAAESPCSGNTTHRPKRVSAESPTWSDLSSSRTAWMASRHSLSMDSNRRSLVSSLSA